MLSGERPEGCDFYIRSPDGKGEMTVWSRPTGDRLCIGLTGRTEHQLVMDILNGKYEHIMHPAVGISGR